MKSYDVIVVGAGPAGSTAAWYLACGGAEVLLIDRAVFPRDKTCACWLNEALFRHFPHLRPRERELVEVPFTSLVLHSADFRERLVYRESRPLGYLSTRLRFDEGLRRLALEVGVEGLEGCGVRRVVQCGAGGAVVELTDERRFRGRLLVGADGANSRIARQTGSLGSPGHGSLFAIGGDIPADPSHLTEFYGTERALHICFGYEGTGYAWIFPKRKHVHVGLGGERVTMKQAGPVYGKLLSDARRAEVLPPGLEEGRWRGALDPAGVALRRRTWGEGVLLVGDAGGFVLPTNGEGIYWGMRSGEIAARIALEALRSTDPSKVLPSYERAWRRELGPFLLGFGGNTGVPPERIVPLLVRRPYLLPHFARIFLGLSALSPLFRKVLAVGRFLRS